MLQFSTAIAYIDFTRQFAKTDLYPGWADGLTFEVRLVIGSSWMTRMAAWNFSVVVIFQYARHVDILIDVVVVDAAIMTIILLLLGLLLKLKLLVVSCRFDINGVGSHHRGRFLIWRILLKL